jgi:CheY-like chemotaxis protein
MTVRKRPICRLLVVEDDAERIELFKQWLGARRAGDKAPEGEDPSRPLVLLECATDGPVALEMVKRAFKEGRRGSSPYQGILLDVDLDLQPKGPAPRQRINGFMVAQALTVQAPPDVPIFVHSMNPAVAPKVVELLEGAEFDVDRVPMWDLRQVEGRPLIEWVAGIVEELEE